MEKFYLILAPRSYELDLRDKDSVKVYFNKNKIDFIIHCGSIGGMRNKIDEESIINENLAMVKNLINAKESRTRMIVFGSGAMFDRDRNLSKVSEIDIDFCEPTEFYGKSKKLIAKLIKNRTDVLCLNIFACYGYKEKDSRFPSYAINQTLLNSDIVINKNAKFDYIWIEDLNKIVAYFVKNKPNYNIINITPTESYTLKEIADIVKKLSQKNIEIKVLNKELAYEYTGNNQLLLNSIPEFKFTPIEEGLKKLYEYKEKETLLFQGAQL